MSVRTKIIKRQNEYPEGLDFVSGYQKLNALRVVVGLSMFDCSRRLSTIMWTCLFSGCSGNTSSTGASGSSNSVAIVEMSDGRFTATRVEIGGVSYQIMLL